MLTCPDCTSGKIVKNGKTYYGKQNHKCKGCGRQFVADNTHNITAERRQDVEALLQERISLRGICRAMMVSMNWLLPFTDEVWARTPADLGVNYTWLDTLSDKALKTIELQADEMWSFVGKKANKQWIWVVYCPAIRQALAYHIGGRSKRDAETLFAKLPIRLRQNCQFATDYWEAYYQTISSEQLRAFQGIHLLDRRFF